MERRQVFFIGFEWKGIKRGLRGYGFKVWLKPKAEPDAYGNARTYSNEVDEDFEDRDYEDGAETHLERQVEVLRQLGPTTYPERPSVK
jgi:hypothetical protein